MGRLFNEMTIPQSDREVLTNRCIEADIEEAIDVAFIDAGMIEDILRDGPETALGDGAGLQDGRVGGQG